MKLPARRRRASDDEPDEFHDADSEGHVGGSQSGADHRAPEAASPAEDDGEEAADDDDDGEGVEGATGGSEAEGEDNEGDEDASDQPSGSEEEAGEGRVTRKGPAPLACPETP